MDVLDIFGGNAGLVWQQLKKKSPLSVKQLSTKTSLDSSAVLVSIGWLAREGKISVEDGNKTPRYGLLD